MRMLLLVLSLLCVPALGADVPDHLKGATIAVKLTDGTESVVKAEDFMVVPRKPRAAKPKPVAEPKVITVEVIKECAVIEPAKPLKNRLSLLGGYGSQSGLDVSRAGSRATVEAQLGLVVGAQYQRMVTERFSLGVQGQTNKTCSVLFGVDF